MSAEPPRLHFVWTGRSFPYHCRLAIESAIVAMPDAAVTVHVFGEHPVGRHVRAVAERREVSIRPVVAGDLFGGLMGGPRPYCDILARLASPAAASNLLRLAILYREGGVYLDLDTLVLRALHDPNDHGAFVGAELVWALNRQRVCRGLGLSDQARSAAWAADWTVRRLDSRLAAGRIGLARRPLAPQRTHRQVNNAVIGAPAGSSFIRAALERALYVDHATRFSLGPHLLNDVAQEVPREVIVLPPSRFYAIPPAQSYRHFEDQGLELPVDAQVMHLVASNHRRLLAQLDERNPRFDHHTAPFWRAGRRVRIAFSSRSTRRLAGSGAA